MDGLFINTAGPSFSDLIIHVDGLKLLAKRDDIEIMRQTIIKDATVWLVPSGNNEDIEFFFIHTGSLEITMTDGPVKLSAGDSFYAKGLKREIFLKTLEDTDLLYISTIPVFSAEIGFQAELTRMMEQINAKDNYTFRHSRNVMRYSVKLYQELKAYCTISSAQSIIVASLFHDIGKCRVPDEILKKKARLSTEEYRQIQQHPIYGAELLKPYFEEDIVNIALMHHEMLDGSGYPNGRKADEIPFCVRILSVADAFDAMTTDRGYNVVRSAEEAALVLVNDPGRYDIRVTETLKRLLDTGEVAVN